MPRAEVQVPEKQRQPARVPQRTCVACRCTRPQAELLRLTRLGGGDDGVWQVTAPHQRRLDGRGRYLCADSSACWSEKRLRRSFGAGAAALAEQLAARTAQAAHSPAEHQLSLS